MLLDRHRIAYLLRLSQIADGSEADRVAHKDALETLLVSLYAGATAAARQSFALRMGQVPPGSKPWAAVRRPAAPIQVTLGGSAPPVLLLVLGQLDDDPDAAEDGNRLPDRDAKEGAPWRLLYAALDSWDIAVIEHHIDASGWVLPPDDFGIPRDQGALVELAPSQVVIARSSTPAGGTPAGAGAPTKAADVGRDLDEHSAKALRVAGVVAGTAATGAAVYGLARLISD
ncbi:hypothetical protein [Nannocystis pusilla]|uniref:Uncharacterized protein n=1 Tax=Nannocystis pusilla TaxID=889268 RepID=A0ABS7TM28_9BACT|nr:hypothetical protein [Nannocystis pusilla]MBZ5709287.1 hypothetical protein [Nannocystis pusilla]